MASEPPPVPFAALIARLKAGDAAAMDEAFLRHQGLVRLVAQRFWQWGEREDREQVAALGLVKALSRFDPDRGASFSTYAVPVMVGELRHWIRDHPPDGWGRWASERRRQLAARLEAHAALGGPGPTVEELARELGWERSEVVEALDRLEPVQSLDAVGDAIGGDGADDEQHWAERVDLQAAVARLSAQDQALLRARFGGGETQAALARRWALSQAEVSRRQARMAARLAELLGPQ